MILKNIYNPRLKTKPVFGVNVNLIASFQKVRGTYILK